MWIILDIIIFIIKILLIKNYILIKFLSIFFKNKIIDNVYHKKFINYLYKYKEKNTDKKKLISSDNSSLNYLIYSNNNNNFVNLNFFYWIFNLILFYIALIDFCHMLYKMGIFSIKSKEKISTLKYYNYYSLEPLSLFILYHIFFIKKQI